MLICDAADLPIFNDSTYLKFAGPLGMNPTIPGAKKRKSDSRLDDF
jgi:hypothetical protein